MSARRPTADDPLRVALAGFGTVGQLLAPRLLGGDIPEVRLTAVTAADLDKARRNAAGLVPRPLVAPLAALPAHADVIVECATYEAFADIVGTAIEAGKPVVCVSAGALGAHLDLIDRARGRGTCIHVASGALPGLDILRCARESGLVSVRLTTRVRPVSLAREPYVLARGFDFTTPPRKPVAVFEGTARQAAEAFPRHFNVAVAVGLAGAGLDETRVELWCDAGVKGAVHLVEAESRAIGLTMQSRNIPSEANPSTSAIVGPSVLAALREMVAPVRVGS